MSDKSKSFVNQAFREALNACDDQDIHIFFELFRQREFKKIGILPVETLTALQERVKLLSEVESMLIQERSNS